MEPAFFLRVPVAVALTFATYSEADSLYDRALTEHIQDSIINNAGFYDDLIASDFRYHRVKESLEEGTIDHSQALKQAYWTYLAYNKYYSYEATEPENQDLPSQMNLLHHMLFAHLKNRHGKRCAAGRRIHRPS